MGLGITDTPLGCCCFVLMLPEGKTGICITKTSRALSKWFFFQFLKLKMGFGMLVGEP